MRTDSPDHNAKGTPSVVATAEAAAQPPTACRHTVSGSFHSPPGVLFTFPSRYWCTIGHERVFRLGGWSPRIPAGLLVSHGTRDTARGFDASRTGLSPSLADRSKSLRLASTLPYRGPTTPTRQAGSVWPGPRSLAATRGIAVAFSSSGYLDVSVPRVGSSCEVTELALCWVAPFGHRGITACVRLPRAYRSLPRPSSPSRAKASTVRLLSLDLNSMFNVQLPMIIDH